MKAYKRTQWYNQPIRLSEKQMKDPGRILEEFFTWYHLDDIRQILWEWMQVAMVTDNDVFESGRDRNNLLFFYRNIEILVEAAYLLRKQKKQEKKK